MQLYERDDVLNTLHNLFVGLDNGGGHTVCIIGEAGIGKSSLTQYFINGIREKAHVFEGFCDFLFTPRPLGPLYDFANAFHPDLLQWLEEEGDRSRIFSRIFETLQRSSVPVVMLFEDIHWADEATLDLIKFLGRRIQKIRCLFILTFRDDEVFYGHSLKHVFGEIPTSTYTKIRLNRLSKETVSAMARQSQVPGDEVYRVSSGNPFFVKEILANYRHGVPESIKDLVMSVFIRQPENVRELWELISIFPAGMDIWLLNKLYPEGLSSLDQTLQSGIILCDSETLRFKHELYRTILEDSISMLKKMQLHKLVLRHLIEQEDKTVTLVKVVHHAKNAHDWKVVETYAPKAALQAVSFGAHAEASRLYATAIQYCNRTGPDLAFLYESYAYECYLTNQIREAIVGQEKALEIWRLERNKLKEGSSLRFISRLSWFAGNRDYAEEMGSKAIQVLEQLPPSKDLVIAYSNYGQLKMLCDDIQGTIAWTRKTLAMVDEFNLEDIKSHALNNLGTIQTFDPSFFKEGLSNLEKSLFIAIQNGYHEHAARAYTNIIAVLITTRNYAEAERTMIEGLKYCYDRDLESWTYYKMMLKTRLTLELGQWKDAEDTAAMLLMDSSHPEIVLIGAYTVQGILFARSGKPEEAFLNLDRARTLAVKMKEPQRSVPVACALLEYGWLYNAPETGKDFLEITLQLFTHSNNVWHFSELLYWMRLTGQALPPFEKLIEEVAYEIKGDWEHAAIGWRNKRCIFQLALALTHGGANDKREAFRILQELGAVAVIDRLKSELRNKGVSAIPRGSRKSTALNPALLTSRQVEVLQLLQKGLQNHEIAEHLFVSSKTIDNHLASIFSKLHVNTRTKAVAAAARLGILK
jgi:ATP/maltotriose-dependent transcriptional regulator MalT